MVTVTPRQHAAMKKFTAQQLRIIHLVIEGKLSHEIAAILGLHPVSGEQTVRNYVSTILRRLGFRNRTTLAVWFSATKGHLTCPQCGYDLTAPVVPAT